MKDLSTKYYRVKFVNKTLFITSRDREGLACALMLKYLDKYDVTDIEIPENFFFYKNSEANAEICKIVEVLDRILNCCARPDDMILFEKYDLFSARLNTFYVPENIFIMDIEPNKRTVNLIKKVFCDEVNDLIYLIWYDKHEKTYAINWDEYDFPLISTYPAVNTVTEGFREHIMDEVNMAYDNMEMFDELPDENEPPTMTFVGSFVIDSLAPAIVKHPERHRVFNKVIEKYKYPCEAFNEICRMLDSIDAENLEYKYRKYFRR